MYCKKCGKLIGDEDRFCGYCGAMIENKTEEKKPTEEFDWKNEEPEETIEAVNSKKEEISFNWNLDGFPSTGQKRTDTVDFDWNSVIDEKERARYNSFFSNKVDKAEESTSLVQDEPDGEVNELNDLDDLDSNVHEETESLTNLILERHENEEDSAANHEDEGTGVEETQENVEISRDDSEELHSEGETDQADIIGFEWETISAGTETADFPEFEILKDTYAGVAPAKSTAEDEVSDEEAGEEREIVAEVSDDTAEVDNEILEMKEELPEVPMEEYEVDIEVPELKVVEPEAVEEAPEATGNALQGDEDAEAKEDAEDDDSENMTDLSEEGGEVSEPENEDTDDTNEEPEQMTDFEETKSEDFTAESKEMEIELPEVLMEEYEVELDVPELKFGECEIVAEPSEAGVLETSEDENEDETETDDETDAAAETTEEVIDIKDMSDLEPENMLKDYVNSTQNAEDEEIAASAADETEDEHEEETKLAMTEEEKRSHRLERATLYYKMELLKKLLELENGDISEEELLSHYDEE